MATTYQAMNRFGRRVNLRRSPTPKPKPKESTVTCDLCKRVLSCNSSLAKHQLVHLKEKKKLQLLQSQNSKAFQCPDCMRVYTTEVKLQRHRAIHSGTQKKYFCDFCPKEFNYCTARRLHISNHHTKNKPFACHFCDKKFGISGNLKNHLRTHSAEMHACNQCEVPFKTPMQLARHMNDAHTHEIEVVVPVVAQKKVTIGIVSRRKKGKSKHRSVSKQLSASLPTKEGDSDPLKLTFKKVKRSRDSLEHLSEAEILPERSTRNRRPPLRYSQAQVPVNRKGNKYLKPSYPSEMDPRGFHPNGRIPVPFQESEIELDMSQLEGVDGVVVQSNDSEDGNSPIILNSYSLATRDEIEDDSEYYEEDEVYPSCGNEKVICKFASGLVLAGVQFPRF